MINKLRLTLFRVKNMLKYIPHQIVAYFKWECETCRRCGRTFHFCWSVSDELWKKYSGYPDGDGVLCPDCFVELCSIAGKELCVGEISIKPFQPDLKC